MKLTGRYRFRQNILGKLILQLEVLGFEPDMQITLRPGVNRVRPSTFWRDAKCEDLSVGKAETAERPDQ